MEAQHNPRIWDYLYKKTRLRISMEVHKEPQSIQQDALHTMKTLYPPKKSKYPQC